MAERNNRGDKAVMRDERTRQRNQLSAGQREIWSSLACGHAAAFLEKLSVTTFMAYVSFRSELDLTPLIEWGWRTGRTVVVPRCIAADRSMKLYILSDWKELSEGAYGIMEPDPGQAPELESDRQPEVVFVPGLAFDLAGGRLGYGGGYYDRLAARLRAEGTDKPGIRWIGAAFDIQRAERVALDDHDLRLDGVVTEKGFYSINANR